MPGPKLRPLDRRTLLRGAGAALALPWLESMAPARSSAAPMRLACLFTPNGMLPRDWRPRTEGRGYELSPTLAPLAPIKGRVVVLGNLFNRASRAGEGHYVKTTAWLSGAPVKRTGGRELRVGTSVDQHVAARVGRSTAIDSLVLGIEPARNRVDMGYSTVYGANVSWRTPTQPAERELSPRRAFERLVRWTGGPRDGRRKAVLDLVHEEAKGLRRKLGGADRHKLEEYLDSVQALEQRVAAFEASARDPIAGEPPAADPGGYVQHIELMLDLIALAFRSDATRVATFMFGNAVSGRNFSFLDGVDGGHHPLSHHENREEKMAQYALINRWHVAQYVALLERLAAVPEGEGTLLDRTLVLFGSGLADGNRHDPNDLPILLGGGPFRGGRHVRQPKLTPLCNLYVSLLGALGLADESFGDSTGPLDGLA